MQYSVVSAACGSAEQWKPLRHRVPDAPNSSSRFSIGGSSQQDAHAPGGYFHVAVGQAVPRGGCEAGGTEHFLDLGELAAERDLHEALGVGICQHLNQPVGTPQAAKKDLRGAGGVAETGIAASGGISLGPRATRPPADRDAGGSRASAPYRSIVFVDELHRDLPLAGQCALTAEQRENDAVSLVRRAFVDRGEHQRLPAVEDRQRGGNGSSRCKNAAGPASACVMCVTASVGDQCDARVSVGGPVVIELPARMNRRADEIEHLLLRPQIAAIRAGHDVEDRQVGLEHFQPIDQRRGRLLGERPV